MRIVLLALAVLTISFIHSILYRLELASVKTTPRLSDRVVIVTTTTTPPSTPSLSNNNHIISNITATPSLNFSIPTEEWHQPRPLAPWQDTDKPLCTRDQVRQGSWVPTHLEKVPYITPTTHLRCHPREYYDQTPFPTWRWQPSASCDFSKFRQEMMCKLLVDATVTITGDSLSWEHYSSMVQLLGTTIHQGFQHQSLEFRTNIVQHLECGGKEDRVVRLVYRRDDRLEDLLHTIQQDFPTVLVLNRGAHYADDTVLLKNVNDNMELLQKYWWKPCQDMGLHCHLFWRTTVPGHPNCQQFTQPINDRAAMEAWIGNRSNYNNDEKFVKYGWHDFGRQNQLVEQAWNKANYPVTILDAYDLNILRPDDHRTHQDDCLHNCYPGKMDVYSQLMLHYVRMDRTLEAVQNQHLVAPQLNRSSVNPTVYDKEGWMRLREERTAKKKEDRRA